MSNPATKILPHHRFSHSPGALKARVRVKIAHVFEVPDSQQQPPIAGFATLHAA